MESIYITLYMHNICMYNCTYTNIHVYIYMYMWKRERAYSIGDCCQAYACILGNDAGCKSCVGQDSRTSDAHCATCNSGYFPHIDNTLEYTGAHHREWKIYDPTIATKLLIYGTRCQAYLGTVAAHGKLLQRVPGGEVVSRKFVHAPEDDLL